MEMGMASKTMLWIMTVLFIFSVSVNAETVVINSRDWVDVYSGVMYANFNGYKVAFLNSPNPAGLFNILPKDKIILLESDQPMVGNFENLIRTKGYDVVSVRRMNNFNTELYNELNLKKFILVEESYPYAAIIASPYAYLTKSWVFVVNDNNVNNIVPLISNSNGVLAYGLFKRSIKNAIKPYITKEINSGNKFKDSLELADEFAKIKPFKQVLITDGASIEQELLSGSKGVSPALLVGNNLLPDVTLDYIKKRGIRTAVVIGGNLGVIGEKIRQKTNKQVAVFIKFGQSVSGADKIYALTMFPLPLPELNLEIISVFYDPSQKKVFIKFKNIGNVGVFEFTTLRIKNGDKEITSVSDTEPVFIGAGEEAVNPYDISLPDELLSERLDVEFYTTYGETVDGLEKYITSEGRYGPPLAMPLEIKSIEDKSDIEIENVKYYPSDKRFAVGIKNTGDVNTWVSVTLTNVMVNGIRKSIVYDGKKMLEPGDEKEFYIKAELDRFDIEDNDVVSVKAIFGENKDAMIKSRTAELPMEVVNTGLVGMITGGEGSVVLGVAVLVILVIVILIFRKR